MNQVATKKQANTTTSNQFSVTGRLGVEPRVVNFTNSSLCELSIACDEPGKQTKWYTVVLWNQVGQVAAKYLKTGDKVTVRGEFRFDTWTDKSTAEERRKLKLVVNDRFGLDLPSKSTTRVAPAPAPTPVVVDVEANEISDADWERIQF